MKKNIVLCAAIVFSGVMEIRVNAGKEPVKVVPQFVLVALKRQKSNNKELKQLHKTRSFTLLQEGKINTYDIQESQTLESPKRYIKRKNSRVKELIEEYKKQKKEAVKLK